MTKMTKMLRYQTSSGATGACAIYTTESECPYPNLKVQVDGTNGYVKLSDNASDPNKTPIKVYVNSNGKTFSALTEAIPSGSQTIPFDTKTPFTVPNFIKVIKVGAVGKNPATYVGVTPNATYNLFWVNMGFNGNYKALAHNRGYYDENSESWGPTWQKGYRNSNAVLYWSSEINKQTPTVTDYL